MRDSTLNILIGGEAGQGLVTVGQLLAKTLVRSGYSIVVTQNYESRIRGGHNTFAIRVGPGEVIAPMESIDLLVAFDEETVALHGDELTRKGLVILDEAHGRDRDDLLKVPFKELAEARYHNVVALGVVGSLLGLDERSMAGVVDGFFGKKKPEMAEANRAALADAVKWAEGQAAADCALPEVAVPLRRLMMNGNEAIALGAISAGLKFAAFYPMTPATSVVLNVAAQSRKMGLIVEQAEDEIAAINMAIGASFAGTPAMVATSGGGFALMVEGVSLAAMTETPVVVVVAQRPGPATGLPTKTEQGDLDLVLHAGHGEFPRAIFAPGTIEQCFHLTRRAFELAQRYQGPMFLLTDQFLADSYRAVMPFETKHLKAVPVGIHTAERMSSPYKRYAFTDSGVSPRLLPGMGKQLVVADSDEHTEEGHIGEAPSLRIKMVEKRLAKGTWIASEAFSPEMQGGNRPDLLLVSWGSSKGAVQEAAGRLASGGKKVATLHFSQVWPLVPEQFMEYLENAHEVVCIEGNAAGQFARLIRRETGFHIRRRILRYDGLPLTPGWILRALDANRN
jgi:2-oxoglutarate ferredoxin oxidoreductase subunit alpha